MRVQATDSYAIDLASRAISRGEVICLPTDTVYGIGADPFSVAAITRLLTVKSRTRANPPPVLVAGMDQARALVEDFSPAAQLLMETFWPGALTIVLRAKDSIGWDLGETGGTVALRMPDSQPALELLRAIGPLAVTSANLHGKEPATTIDEAYSQLSDAVTLYLDAGVVGGGQRIPSTIIDVTADPKIIRHGAIPTQDIGALLGVKL